MKEETVIDRLKQFIYYSKKKGYVKSISSFEAMCGISNGYVNNISHGKKKGIGSENIARIALKFPMLNVRWLCTGEGNMVNDQSTYKKEYSNAMKLASELIEVIEKIAKNDTNAIP